MVICNAIPAIDSIVSCLYDSPKPSDSVYQALVGVGCHVLDIVCSYIANDYPVKVQALQLIVYKLYICSQVGYCILKSRYYLSCSRL